jgi:gluconokinase
MDDDDESCESTRAPCLVVMGVAGAGKSTLASALGTGFGLPYLDADAYHPPANVEKMKRGEALTDEDRVGWLATLRGLLDQAEANGHGIVLACSALKANYREVLGVPGGRRFLIYIQIDHETARRRVSRRVSHYMPPTLVDSQFAALEPPKDAIIVEAAWPVQRAVRHVCDVVRDAMSASDVAPD